jgi:hypothetical protein
MLYRSMVIDELKRPSSIPQCPVAFSYFEHKDQDCQTPKHVISSILRQIVASMPEIPSCVSDAYEQLHNSGASLPLHVLEKMSLDIIGSTDRTYILIDALDECVEPKHKGTFLQFISRLSRLQAARVFVTSRENCQDIDHALRTYPQITIRAHDYDLSSYMYREMDHAGIEDLVDNTFATKIIETIIKMAQGM